MNLPAHNHYTPRSSAGHAMYLYALKLVYPNLETAMYSSRIPLPGLAFYMPLLNSTLPSLPPFSQNSSSNVLASKACLCGNAARARGKAKIDVVRIRPIISQLQSSFYFGY